MTEVVFVTQDGCRPCLRVRKILHDIQATRRDLEIREVRLNSDEGFELARSLGILFPPALVIRGRLFGQDEIDDGALRRALAVRPIEVGA